MAGGFSTNHAVRSGTNRQLCSRCLIVQWLLTLLESQFRESKNKRISLMFCMRLHCLKNCAWTRLRCHTSPSLARGWVGGMGVVSLLCAPHGWAGADVWHFKLRILNIYVHRGINKGCIQRKCISFLWVGRKGHNEQTDSFPMKWCVVWLSHFPYCTTQSKKTVIIKIMIFYERFQKTIDGIIQ